jgi:hypothetical protein
MSFARIFLYILLAIFLYKFVFDLLVPIVKMTWRVRRQVKEFQRQHQQQQDPLQNNTSATRPASGNNGPTAKPKAGEYIDFEEVKES